jgi:hypothetical protein
MAKKSWPGTSKTNKRVYSQLRGDAEKKNNISTRRPRRENRDRKSI